MDHSVADDAQHASNGAASGTQAADEVLAALGATEPGIPTGYADLDHLTGGLHPGQLTIIAARSGAGKSTAALDIVRSAAVHHGRYALLFSLEMTRSEISMRLLSAEGRVRLSDMRNGCMSENDWSRINRASNPVRDARLLIDDSPHLTMSKIRDEALRRCQDGQLDLVLVDYLQLLTTGRAVESRQQEVAELSRRLKRLARELEVPVVATSQLNRSPESRQGRVPVLTDLRDSGAIEEDADLVLLIHRPDMYEPESRRMGEADLILAKHRTGPTATFTVAHQMHYSRFVDMARE